MLARPLIFLKEGNARNQTFTPMLAKTRKTVAVSDLLIPTALRISEAVAGLITST